jgi:chromosome segregation ATPase
MAYRELKTSLQTLSDQSLKVSRHLDNTYYSILEKVSLWRQTIGSLQELAGLTKELNENFEADTQGLAEDIQGQFEGFDNFDAQQEQVTALEGRIKEGKEKADALHARLAAAQQRIEARAKAEEELETRKIRTCCHSLIMSAFDRMYRASTHRMGHPRHHYRPRSPRHTLPATQTVAPRP